VSDVAREKQRLVRTVALGNLTPGIRAAAVAYAQSVGEVISFLSPLHCLAPDVGRPTTGAPTRPHLRRPAVMLHAQRLAMRLLSSCLTCLHLRGLILPRWRQCGSPHRQSRSGSGCSATAAQGTSPSWLTARWVSPYKLHWSRNGTSKCLHSVDRCVEAQHTFARDGLHDIGRLDVKVSAHS
jgi:hypothetical protein